MHGVTIDKSMYPVVEINVKFLNYRWEAPQFPKYYPKNHHHILYKMAQLESRFRKNIPPPEKMNDRDWNIYNSIKMNLELKILSFGDAGLFNPLIIKQSDYTDGFDRMCYYVVVGNRRLCALRALDYGGMVPCVVSLKNDKWHDGTRVKEHIELIHIEGIDR